MNKFYPIIAVAILVGVGIVFLQDSDSIRFSDIETECRIQDDHEVNINLNPDDSLSFEGNFPVENTEADITHSFKKTDNLIRLRVSSSELPRPDSFEHTCLGSVVYKGQSDPIEPGTYFLEIYHNDQQVERSLIQIE